MVFDCMQGRSQFPSAIGPSFCRGEGFSCVPGVPTLPTTGCSSEEPSVQIISHPVCRYLSTSSLSACTSCVAWMSFFLFFFFGQRSLGGGGGSRERHAKDVFPHLAVSPSGIVPTP